MGTNWICVVLPVHKVLLQTYLCVILMTIYQRKENRYIIDCYYFLILHTINVSHVHFKRLREPGVKGRSHDAHT